MSEKSEGVPNIESDDTQPISVPVPVQTQRPSKGRIVLYNHRDRDQDGQPIEMEESVGIVTKVNDDGSVNLQLLMDMAYHLSPIAYVEHDPIGKKPCTWHWPPRVP